MFRRRTRRSPRTTDHDRAECLADAGGAEALAANNAVSITRLIGSTHCLNSGDGTSGPSTAPSTVIGGVIMPSPKNSAAPKMPRNPHRGQPRTLLPTALHQRGERHDPALAVVVGAHDHHHVLQGHHQHQRPEAQREQALHRRRIRGSARNAGGTSPLMVYSGLVPMSPTPRRPRARHQRRCSNPRRHTSACDCPWEVCVLIRTPVFWRIWKDAGSAERRLERLADDGLGDIAVRSHRPAMRSASAGSKPSACRR